VEVQLVDVGGGRVLDVADVGPTASAAVVWHSGTPTGLVPYDPLITEAVAHDLRVVTTVRPGYSRSTPMPGRSVADVVPDIVAVVDALGIDRYVAVGFSGGGPHALACRALDAPRCSGAVLIGSVAPSPAAGLDWFDGMGQDNVDEFRAAVDGEAAITTYLEARSESRDELSAEQVIDALDSLLPDVDRKALRDGMADYIAAALRTGVDSGIAGWRDDDLAFTRPWGFELPSLTGVAVWHGSADLAVPFAHGQWLARAIPASTAHLLEGEGHLSVLAGQIGAILDEAMALLA
jgi:pimeloyl-ACP methyl ester carboxylesterase